MGDRTKLPKSAQEAFEMLETWMREERERNRKLDTNETNTRTVEGAERIVACVNALAGVADPAAFMRKVHGLRDDVQDALEASSISHEDGCGRGSECGCWIATMRDHLAVLKAACGAGY